MSDLYTLGIDIGSTASKCIILKNGKEFNIAYLKGPSLISLLRDEVSAFTSAPFNIRVESELASFYKVPRVELWNDINRDVGLQQYVKEYYAELCKKNGGPAKTAEFARLFLVPGGWHSNMSANALGYLKPWVEKGRAPEKISVKIKYGGKTYEEIATPYNPEIQE